MVDSDPLPGPRFLVVVVMQCLLFTQTHSTDHFISSKVNGTGQRTESISVNSKDKSGQKLLALEKEVLDTLMKSDFRSTRNVLPGDAVECLLRNGSLHITKTVHQTGEMFSTNLRNKAKHGHNVFCWIRWTIRNVGEPGTVGTVGRFHNIECNNPDDIVSLYELNTTVPAKPRIKKLGLLCDGSEDVEYYGQTNEMLMIIFVEDTAFQNEYVFRISAVLKSDLEIHYLSNLAGILRSMFVGSKDANKSHAHTYMQEGNGPRQGTLPFAAANPLCNDFSMK